MSEEPRQVVRSPEQVALHLPIAGPTSRMVAYFVDYVVLLATQVALFVLLVLAFPALGQALAGRLRAALQGLDPASVAGEIALVVLSLFLLVQVILEAAYFVFFEMTTGGRSAGKGLLGLRVVRDGGFPLGIRESLVRNLLRAVDVLPWSYVVGLVAVVLSPEGKRLGDLAAGTIVVRLDRPPAALPVEPPAGPAAFRFEREQVARLGPNELALLRATLRRLPDLEPAQAEDALVRAAEVLAARIGHAPVGPAEHEAFLRVLLEAVRLR